MINQKDEVIKCESLPLKINNYDIFEITDKNVTCYTHIMHKYPSKFIPHIPRWAINKYSNEGDIVLDPFMGSATTLIEAKIHNRNSIGIDINPLSQLIAKVKTSNVDTELLEEAYIKLINNYKNDRQIKEDVIPAIPNINKWFTYESILNLSIMKHYILEIDNQDIKDFMLVVFSAIIRKTSNAEYRSQKTYISSRFRKEPKDVYEIFNRRFYQYLEGMKEFNKVKSNSFAETVIGNASDFNKDIIKLSNDEFIDLVITSPPYVTAVEYPSVFKLEYQWLDFFNDADINEHRKSYIGTDRVYANEYKKNHLTGIEELDTLLTNIHNTNPKKSYILYKYLRDMKLHLECAYAVLKTGGKYVLVVGNNSVMNIEIPISEYLIKIAENIGFTKESIFSYILKDIHLVIPRNGRGGIINKEWIIVFEKR